jgi:hypothetical protein
MSDAWYGQAILDLDAIEYLESDQGVGKENDLAMNAFEVKRRIISHRDIASVSSGKALYRVRT